MSNGSFVDNHIGFPQYPVLQFPANPLSLGHNIRHIVLLRLDLTDCVVLIGVEGAACGVHWFYSVTFQECQQL